VTRLPIRGVKPLALAMGIEAALPAGRELLNVTEYLHMDGLPAMVHLF